jgi:UDP-N-acetyl-D-mannosaminuronate dehydrogenase
VIERLAAIGANIAFHDPFVSHLDVAGEMLTSMPLTEEIVRAQDCVAILTAHRAWTTRGSRVLRHWSSTPVG